MMRRDRSSRSSRVRYLYELIIPIIPGCQVCGFCIPGQRIGVSCWFNPPLARTPPSGLSVNFGNSSRVPAACSGVPSHLLGAPTHGPGPSSRCW